MPAGGSHRPASHETVDKRMHYVHQDGRNVFKFAVRVMCETSVELLRRNGIPNDQLSLFVPHQANMRIIRSSMTRLKLREEQVAVNIDRYANTTAATIPTCLAEAHRQGRLKKRDKILMVSFGAGFTWGGILLGWGMDPP